ncbi:uncharacterized protein LOC130014437 [Patella vulgata]|uniref:uncharacterized protein LOC130014437 n=1 Tax=Patella vulgata TaxID=6465 RepID=UPI0024A9B619|nr:uncharacterized protein LOC130014437 [Patella vulgata]XP_055959539.1 uncharacterized protein LOC130014437 [Patella vulgata]
MLKIHNDSRAEFFKILENSLKNLRQPEVVINSNRKRDSTRRETEISDSDEDIPLTQRTFKKRKLDTPDKDVSEQIDDLLADDRNKEALIGDNSPKTASTSTTGDNDVNVVDFGIGEVLDSLEQDYSIVDKVGNNINPKVASIVKQIFSSKLPDEKLLELLNKTTRPGNVDIYLQSVNAEIWGSSIKGYTRSKDIKYQKLGELILKSSYTMMSLVDKLLETKKELPVNKDLLTVELKLAMDCMSLLGHTVQTLNQSRRDSIKFDINPTYKPICNQSQNLDTGSSKFLFGDDICKKLKELKEAAQIGSNVTSSKNYSQGYGVKGNSRYSNNNYKGKSFLYQGNYRYKKPPAHQYQYNKKMYQNQKTSWKKTSQSDKK